MKKLAIKKNYILYFISLFLYLFYAYNISINEYAFHNSFIIFTILTLSVLIAFLLNRRQIIYMQSLTYKIAICILIVAMMILLRNGDLINNHWGLPFYYVISLLLFFILCHTENWISVAITIFIIFSLEHVICTWLFYMFPKFYFNQILPIFPDMFQQDLKYQFYNGQIAGLTYHYSTNAMYLSIANLIFFSLVLKKDTKKFTKVLYFILLVLSFGALLLTAKRAHFIFVIISFIILYFVYNKDNYKQNIIRMITIFIISTFVLLILANFIPSLNNTFDRIHQFAYSSDFSNGRFPLYSLALELFKKHPLIGNGWGSYKYFYLTQNLALSNYSLMDVHNIYLQLLCEVGIFGTLLFLFLFGKILFDTIVLLRHSECNANTKCFLTISLGIQVFILLYGMTGNPIYDVQMFFQYILAISICYSIKFYNVIHKFKKESNIEETSKNGKIGILTFDNTTNYGAELQKYALQMFLINQNYNVEVINYRCSAIEKREIPMKLTNQKNIKDIIKCIIRSDSQFIRYAKFKEFSNKYIINSSKVYNRNNVFELNNIYDTFIVGSDQVWNMNLTGGDLTYFLDFVDDNQKKKTYAASFGYDKIPKQYFEINKEYLRQFHTLNVREKQAKKILEEITNKNVNVTIDPTFLLARKKWQTLIPESSNVKGDFILVYLPYYSKTIFRFIKKMAKIEKCKIIYIHGSLKNELGMKNLRTASPTDFLKLIRDAKYIITGSFHAICFSIIFHKEFYYTVSPMKEFNSRLENLILITGIKNRKIISDTYKKQRKINYKNVDIQLTSFIEKSKKILLETIKD